MTLWALLRNYGRPFESGVGVDRRVFFCFFFAFLYIHSTFIYIYSTFTFMYIKHSHLITAYRIYINRHI